MLGEMGGVRRRQDDRLRPELLDRAEQPVGAAGADGDVAEAEPLEGCERGAGGERTGVVRGDDLLARGYPGGGVAPRGPGDPVVEVAGRQRHVTRRPGRAARGVDAHELGRVDAEVRADRVLGRRRGPELVLLGEREPR